MAILCGWAAKDEREKFRWGKAGDQTGAEVHTGEWYDFGQNVILRPKDPTVAETMAVVMKEACDGGLVGYDQRQRTTFYKELKKVGWDITQLKKACETDCSAMIAVCANAAGIPVSPKLYTGNLREGLLGSGAFVALEGEEFTRSDARLKRGDVILSEEGHVILALEDGPEA